MSAILYEKWEASLTNKYTIIGIWPEDGSEYSLTVPYQLRDEIISMQNMLVDKAKKIEQLQSEVEAKKNEIYRLKDAYDFFEYTDPDISSISSTLPHLRVPDHV